MSLNMLNRNMFNCLSLVRCTCTVKTLNIRIDRSEQTVQTWPRGYKTFLMLNSVEHEILNAYKYKKYQEIQIF